MTSATTETAGCDTTDMVIVHRMFQREFHLLPKMVRAVPPLDTQRAKLVAEHAEDLVAAVHHHHNAEDELLWPKLAARVSFDADLVGRMQRQHALVAELLADVERLLPAWRSTASRQTRNALAAIMVDLSEALEEHQADEELEVLPVVEQYVSRQEWAELGERGRASIPRKRLPLFLGAILEDATPNERVRFLAGVPLAGRIAYRLFGARSYARHTAVLRAGLSTLTQSPCAFSHSSDASATSRQP